MVKRENDNNLPADKQKQDDSKKQGFVSSFFSFENLRSLAILIAIIFAFRWSVVSPYYVPTASMEPTIKVGDRLLANKLAYNLKIPFTDIVVADWSAPKRGDIIVFKYPKSPDTDYVKRVVGVAGDDLQVIDDVLFINGKPQPRQNHESDRKVLDDIDDNKDSKILFTENLDGREHWVIQTTPRRYMPSNWPAGGLPYKVPENSVFVMGDNRDNSTDSRIWGEVPLSYIRGKAMFVIWSVYRPADANWYKFRFYRSGQWLN